MTLSIDHIVVMTVKDINQSDIFLFKYIRNGTKRILL